MKRSDIIANIMAGFSIFVALITYFLGYFSQLLGCSDSLIFMHIGARHVTTCH